MARVVNPGALRTELVLEQPGQVPDGAGGHVETWTAAATVLALLLPVRASDRYGADQTLEEVTHRITLRWRDGVASGQRFRKGARLFTILTVHDPDETGRYLVARTREVGA